VIIGLSVPAVLVGIAVLLGWAFDLSRVKSVLPGLVEMKVNTAICLSLAGTALILARSHGSGAGALVVRALGAVVLTTGVLTCLEFVAGWDLGIDNIFFADQQALFAPTAGRMSPFSALSFTMLGAALLVLPASRIRLQVVLPLAVFVILVGFVSLIGYLLGVSEIITDKWVPPVALHTAAALLTLGAALAIAALVPTRAVSDRVVAIDVERGMVLLFTAVFAVLVLFGGLAYRMSAGLAVAAGRIVEVQRGQSALDAVERATLIAESTQRSRILTDAPALDATFTAALDTLEVARDELRRTVSTPGLWTDTSREDVARLDSLVAERAAALRATLVIHRQFGITAARRLIADGEGISLMTQIREVIGGLSVAEDVVALQRQADFERGRVRVLIAILGAIVLTAVGFTVVFTRLATTEARRRRAEEELRSSEANLESTLHSIGDAVLSMDARGCVVRMNPLAEQLSGWSATEASGRPVGEVLRLVDDASGAPVAMPLEAVLERGESIELANHITLIAKDGSHRAIADSFAPIRGAGGVITGAVIVFRDVSEQRAARAAIARQAVELRELNAHLGELVEERTASMEEAHARFEQLFENAPDALVVADARGVITMLNRQAEGIFGASRTELVGETIERLVPADLADGNVELRQQFAEASRGRPMGVGRRFEAVRADGVRFPVEVSLSPLRFREGAAVAAAVRDISERVKLESQLLQSQRVETVGRLAGGIAHDFNNLLTVILNTVDLAERALVDAGPLRDDLSTIRTAAARSAALTGQLLAFSRKQILQPTRTDVNEVVRRVLPMLRRLIDERIEVSQSLSSSACVVMADPVQLEQVLLNVAINARDAMPDGGRLLIESKLLDLDAAYARSHPTVAPGPHVMLAVSDTGVGMDEETKARMFDPFFTTKELGRGTGLGLSTVYGIVKQTGGHVWVYSEPGMGTSIKVYLPAVGGEASNDAPRVPQHLSAGSETILVVEDEEILREVAVRILQSAGYTVLTASHGAEAIDRLSEHGPEVSLVLTDVVMPGMSAREMAASMAERFPSVRVLYTSGYTDDAVLRHGVLDVHLDFIGKPYTIEGLTRKVREVLDKP